MLAVGDKDLLTGDQVVALVGRFRTCTHRGEIGARLRLGEVHGARPLTRDEPRQIQGFLRRTTLKVNGFRCSLGQHRAEAKRHVGAVPHLLHRRAERPRQALTTILGIQHQADPAGLAELHVGFLPARRGRHHAIFDHRSLGIAGTVQRRQHVAGKLTGLGKDRIDQIGARLLKPGPGRNLVDSRQVLQGKAQVCEWRGVIRHNGLLR